jgi:predicted RNA binding protein YcfA (HicA-like mRNA interferase family)
MGTLANISGKEAAKAFRRAGWVAMGQSGSHLIMTKTGSIANLSVPQHKELAAGTLRGLIRLAEMSVDQFLDLL